MGSSDAPHADEGGLLALPVPPFPGCVLEFPLWLSVFPKGGFMKELSGPVSAPNLPARRQSPFGLWWAFRLPQPSLLPVSAASLPS